MRCSKCGSDNREGRKFCTSCGASLIAACPKCGAAIQPGERFCGECGGPLPVPAAAPSAPKASAVIDDSGPAPNGANSVPEGERKLITALFADIKGSTELMREIDPEEARALIDPVLQLMMDAVHRYDGYVAQSTGDGIFAMFGAPVAHEDHPQRALHAALAIQQELRTHNERLAEREDHRLKPVALEARIGINTGEAVLRIVNTGGHTEYSPVGHVANLAARMQAVAPTGSIVITEETRRLVEGYFSLRALGPTEIKGIVERVNVYEVIGPGRARGHFERAAQRGLTRFVGREHELAELRRALEFATGGRGQIVAVVAEAGTGKSRLFYEFKATLPDACKLLEAYSVSHGKASAWLPVLELLRDYFNIEEADDPISRREKVRAGQEALDPSLSDVLPYLFGLLGIQEDSDPLAHMDPQARRQRTLDAIKRIILQESLSQPIVLIFEDLHWIDSQTQALLDLLADSLASARVLLLVNYRPEYRHEWGNKSCYTQLRLETLTAGAANEMLTTLLGDNVELHQFKRTIIERTQGNPFFIEEMLQALFDEGALVRNGMVKVTRPLAPARLPPTVQGILAARIDRQPAEHKQLLQTLAVIGRQARLGLIRQLVPTAELQLRRRLAELQASEFIYEQPALSDAEYVFKHALTQEVAYNSMLIERRKVLHERAGQVLESMFSDHLDDHVSELARHYSSSGNISKAIDYLQRAGQQALQRCASADATCSLASAIDLLDKLPDKAERIQRELPLQMALGSAFILLDSWAAREVGLAFARALEICEQLSSPPEVFFALFGLWSNYQVRGDYRVAGDRARNLIKLAQSTGNHTHLVLAHFAMSETLLHAGKLTLAGKHQEALLSLYDEVSDRPLAFRIGADAKQHILSYAGWNLWLRGHPDQALQLAKQSVAFAQRLSHPRSVAAAQVFLNMVQCYRREREAVEDTAKRVITISTEYGFRYWLLAARLHAGWAMTEQGRYEEGIELMQRVLATQHKGGADICRTNCLCMVAEACMKANRLDDAFSTVSEALAAVDQQEERYYEAEIHRIRGEVLLRQDHSNNAQAEKCFRKAIEIAREQSGKSLELRATTSLARLLMKQGRRDGAHSMLAEIYGWFTEGFDTADLKEAKALLSELARD